MPELAAGNQVLELAMRMEELARDFYEALASASDQEEVRRFCALACREEDGHHKLFGAMRREWSRTHQAHLVSPAAMEALVGVVKRETYPDAAAVQRVALSGDLPAALATALEMERASIRVYEDMRLHMPDVAETLDRILAEERTHVERLMALAQTAGARPGSQ